MKITKGLIGPRNEEEERIWAEEDLMFRVQELIAVALNEKGEEQDQFKRLLDPDAELTFRQVARELYLLGYVLGVNLIKKK